MSFKNRLMSKIPASYILHKSSNKTEAKLIVKGYNAIRKNNLFDDEFYLNKYPKVKASGMDPLLHYIFFGFNEGKKPNKDFDGVFYKYHYDDFFSWLKDSPQDIKRKNRIDGLLLLHDDYLLTIKK